MPRRRPSSPVSFFSFQDIIMSVVGIVILITLLLILKLISQETLARPVEAPEFSETELTERIESLEQSRREIQDEITALHRDRREAPPPVPSRDQIDALQTSIERLNADLEKIEKDVETAKTRHDELLERPDKKIVAEKEEALRELDREKTERERKNRNLEASVKDRQEKLDDLKNRRAGLERKLSEDIAKKIYVIPHKSTNKTPLILVYGSGAISALSVADPIPQKYTSRNEFFNWAAGRNRTTEYFVLYVRPSRFDEYESVLDRLKSLGFDVGLQVIGEKTEISLQ